MAAIWAISYYANFQFRTLGDLAIFPNWSNDLP